MALDEMIRFQTPLTVEQTGLLLFRVAQLTKNTIELTQSSTRAFYQAVEGTVTKAFAPVLSAVIVLKPHPEQGVVKTMYNLVSYGENLHLMSGVRLVVPEQNDLQYTRKLTFHE